MLAAAVAVAITIALGAVITRSSRGFLRTLVDLNRRLLVVQDSVDSLRRAHEDHVTRLARRFLDVEAASTGAQTEARLISAQLAEHQAQHSATAAPPRPSPRPGPAAATHDRREAAS